MLELESYLEDIYNNIFLDTASWRVDIFEYETNLRYLNDATIEERKQKISAKWRGAGKLTLVLLQDTVKAYTDRVITVELHDDGYLIFDFTANYGYPKYIDSMLDHLNEVKPAHLGIDCKFKLRKWGDMLPYTWCSVQDNTWRDLPEAEVLIILPCVCTTNSPIWNDLLDHDYESITSSEYRTWNSGSIEDKSKCWINRKIKGGDF